MRSVVPPRTRRSALAVVVAAIASGCGDPAAHVRLVPRGGNCARPDTANAVQLTRDDSDSQWVADTDRVVLADASTRW